MHEPIQFHHLGYTASIHISSIEYAIDDEGGVYFLRGKADGILDVITFVGEGRTASDVMASAEKAFRDSVDAYLEFCESLGEEPEKPN